jgi:CRISPR/Cas system-associated exonuclease Cas4 (RecB family)
MLTASGADVKRKVIETSSDVAQVKLISTLINDIEGLTSGNAHHTAVVLADENLLMPVLTSLPENVGDINITMGYPLKLTLVYTLVKHLMDLQRTAVQTDDGLLFSYRDVSGILRHTLMTGLMAGSDHEIIDQITKTNQVWVPSERFADSQYLSGVFRKPLTPALLSVYFKDILSLIASNDIKSDDQSSGQVERNIRNEFIYRIVLSINRLEAIVNNPDIVFTTDTYIKILDRMLRIQSVPFSGEPLSGIQIMGILETRALDFKNLIILSVNDGILPAISSGSSFIPFSLREAFGLPSVNHQESIYAYHFYRLLQRAENVTFIYNSNSEGLRSGEMSRFLIQMKYDKYLKPDFIDLSFEIKSHSIIGEIIERKDEHIQQLNSQFTDRSKGRILSPSAINTWLHCRMKFFYRYVNGLKEPDKVSADIDPAMLGNILHEIMRNVYHDYIGEVLTSEILDRIIINTGALQMTIKEAVREKFKNGGKGIEAGNELIVRDVLMEYLIRILRSDKTISPVTILNLEDNFSFMLSVLIDGKLTELLTGGVADRVDVVSGVTRIVDYKTGTVSDIITSIGDLFSEDRKKDYDGWLQTLLYCEAYLSANQSVIVRPSVYRIKKLSGGLLSDELRLKTDSKTSQAVDDYKTVREEFMDGLRGIISKIFGSNEPFIMTEDIRGKCEYCSYRTLCNR